jgi:4-aminobutyrate aminotransferase-like enzyme
VFIACVDGVAPAELDAELLAHVHEVSAYLRDGLAAFGDVRGLGLLLAVELDRPAAPVVEAALANGLVIGSAGEHVLRLTPPLTLSLDEAAVALELLEGVVA